MKVLTGFHAGREFNLESKVEKTLSQLWNVERYHPARIAMKEFGYSEEDKPFYLGEVNGIKTILCHADLYGEQQPDIEAMEEKQAIDAHEAQKEMELENPDQFGGKA